MAKLAEGSIHLHGFLELLVRLAHASFGPASIGGGVIILTDPQSLVQQLVELLERIVPMRSKKMSNTATRGSILMQSMERDEQIRLKYGKTAFDEYVRRVPYRMVPGVW